MRRLLPILLIPFAMLIDLQADALGSPAPNVDPQPTSESTSPPPRTEEPGSSVVSGTLSYSNIRRRSSASGLRAAVGYDHLLGSAFSLGGRVGVARHSDTFGSSVLPYLGLRAAYWKPMGAHATAATTWLKLGGGAELWLNSADQTGISGEPVFLHLLAEIGPQFRRGLWTIDVPVELGVMPYFSPKVYTLQIGLQVGRWL